MSFFEPPPPEPEPEWDPALLTSPEWFGPARNVLGMPVGERVVLVQRSDLVIAITAMTAFPNGLSFTLLTRGIDERVDEASYPVPPWHRGRREQQSGLPDELLRLGVLTADGKATNYGSEFRMFGDDKEPPAAPFLTGCGGGGGGGGEWNHGYWLWPLPPNGSFEFVCEWPALDVPETHVEVDPLPIREAASQSIILWDESPTLPGGQWSSGMIRSVRVEPAQPDPDES